MTTREFWLEEPDLLWAYRKSYMDKLKLEREINNYNSWLQGLYINESISKCLYNNFGRKQSQPVEHYAAKPYDLNQTAEDIAKEKIKKREQQIKEQNERVKQILINKNKSR